MITLRAFYLAVCGTVMATWGCAIAGTSDTGCHYTPQQLQRWKAGLTRKLHVLDPSHAEIMSKVTAEIMDGQLAALKEDIHSGVSPNASLMVLKMAGPGGDMSLLELAVAACQDKIARELVRLGASANGDESSTPMVVAGAKGEAELAEFLIQHGALVDKVDLEGHTALEDAVREHRVSAVSMLLKLGSDPNIPIAGGATVLDIVAHSSDPADQNIAKELRAYGAISGPIGVGSQ
ncbi:MAG TPA: ankyrin repeat domain-containing protein [Steroidobacteraceae bacterium]